MSDTTLTLKALPTHTEQNEAEVKHRFMRKPPWLKVRISPNQAFFDTRKSVTDHQLHTVCEEARCPNIGECWARGTATFMILGDTCTRSCGFCAIKTGLPEGVDWDEPRRVAVAVQKMNLVHAVITSVNRDELKDGGASIWAETIRQVRKLSPKTRVEVLIPDFKGDWEALDIVIDAAPEILNHNVETVPDLYYPVRPQAKYERSLELLERSKKQGMTTKTGIMVGIGEKMEQVYQLMEDLIKIKVDIFTVGQYLQPTPKHLPIDRWVHPDEFEQIKQDGLKMGFKYVESGPLVRSSYHAEEQVV